MGDRRQSIFWKRAYNTLAHAGDRALALVHGRGWLARLLWHAGLRPYAAPLFYHITLPAGQHPIPPLRIAFAADFHTGPTTHPRTIAAACALLSAVAADLLLLGGDYVSYHTSGIDDLAPQLGRIPAPLGRFAVLGNHDYWADSRYLSRRLEDGGVRLLTNRNVQLPIPYDHVWICGIDDPDGGTPNVEQALAGATGVRIVLMHQPEGIRSLGGARFDIAFCGHTHGGQVVIPGFRPLFIPFGAFNRTYPHGRFAPDSGRQGILLVSRGVGNSVMPLRIGAAPDVLICTVTWMSG